MIITVLPLKRTPLIFFFLGGGVGGHNELKIMVETIILLHIWNISWIAINAVWVNYVCSIVDNNIWSPLWLSIIWLLIHNLNMNTHMHYSNMGIHNSIMDIHNKMIYSHLAIHVIIIIIIIITMRLLTCRCPLHTPSLHALYKIFNRIR